MEIKIRKAEGTWTVRVVGAIMGESRNALEVTEGENPFIIYFPRTDIAMAFLEPSGETSHCPHKGDALFYSIATKNRTLANAAWTYENPKPAVSEIKDYIAFYATSEVTIERV